MFCSKTLHHPFSPYPHTHWKINLFPKDREGQFKSPGSPAMTFLKVKRPFLSDTVLWKEYTAEIAWTELALQPAQPSDC